ncbi:MAG: SDR family NAD(P)-dependent oxidoreductase [Planctomycetaceae bacterium]|nr:SDR family NAD(P)-dependent oxidoreductase [Planctomycetota bacterium]NUN51931.1 SDR family NAD(P)-dependent oxidoreductase [Planctomycetaceae bacterium]
MRVLVTGGAGFIGSHLAEALASRGDQVTVLDDLSTGREENLAALRRTPGFRFLRGDVREAAAVEEGAEGAEAVFHLAAAVGVRLIVEQPVRSIETNIHGTENVLRAAAARGIPILVASSSEVYGKGIRCPFREEDDLVLGPTHVMRWSYAAGKAVDEFLALAHHREHGTRAVVTRFFNTVGPRQVGRYGMVIPRFIEQALAGGPITVYGDGTQTRCFGHVGEVVRACIALLGTEAAWGRVFNVGSPHEVSVQELADKVRALVAPGCPVEKIPFEVAYGPGFEDLERRVPSVERLRAAIGFHPERTLDDFLPEIVADVRGRY